MKRNNFICKVCSELLDDNFSILIHQKKMVNFCGGWFDPDLKEFTVAMKNRMGFEILIHEYSHYLQWKNRKRFFNKGASACGIVFSWLDGKFYKQETIANAISDVITLEWDCEMGALELINKYSLDVDVSRYLKATNAYLMFYHIVHENRKWCKHSPYNPTITASMSDSLQPLEYYQNPDNVKDHQREKYLKILQ
jgi:hypothetical protein